MYKTYNHHFYYSISFISRSQIVLRRFKLPTTTADVTYKVKAQLHKAGFIQEIRTVIVNVEK